MTAAVLSVGSVDVGRCGRQLGQDVVEYGLLIGTVALIVLIAIASFGTQIHSWFSVLAGRITTAGM